MDHWGLANNPALWIVAFLGVVVTLIQSTLILRKAIKAGYEMGITKDEMKNGIKTGVVSSIGPSLGVVGSLLALLVSMGGAVSWVRLSLIGSSNYEAMAANFGASVLGSELSAKMSPEVFVNATWVMGLGCLTALIFIFLFGHKMDTVNNILTNGRKALLPAVSVGAMLGSFAYFNLNNLLKYKTNPKITVAAVVGALIMLVCLKLGERGGKLKWLKDWALTFAMFGGAIVATLIIA